MWWIFDTINNLILSLACCCIGLILISFIFGFGFIDQNTMEQSQYEDNQNQASSVNNSHLSNIDNVSVDSDNSSYNISGVDENGTPVRINIVHG
ncbi:hypothetical protein [Methanobrevibacter boviskoreani]|jgi:uncharacterized protein YpmB|uniref:hypothetical protein n=1 Tax=Methanobrevibacter boviskoreani TaxID=1348249 RepID=UPI0023A8FD25|nr:hypothetical protein [Methanobrevibacter boviskoreani]MCI6930244.1 hypothetical protein [Methanobrevibacter boviskoreani]MDD6257152.1 hypothetical protein [Methanobrevibacter boviskoreani]